MDKVSGMLWAFWVKTCFIEAIASLCFAKIRQHRLYSRTEIPTILSRHHHWQCHQVHQVQPGQEVFVSVVLSFLCKWLMSRVLSQEAQTFRSFRSELPFGDDSAYKINAWRDLREIDWFRTFFYILNCLSVISEHFGPLKMNGLRMDVWTDGRTDHGRTLLQRYVDASKNSPVPSNSNNLNLKLKLPVRWQQKRPEFQSWPGPKFQRGALQFPQHNQEPFVSEPRATAPSRSYSLFQCWSNKTNIFMRAWAYGSIFLRALPI